MKSIESKYLLTSINQQIYFYFIIFKFNSLHHTLFILIPFSSHFLIGQNLLHEHIESVVMVVVKTNWGFERNRGYDYQKFSFWVKNVYFPTLYCTVKLATDINEQISSVSWCVWLSCQNVWASRLGQHN